MANNDKEERTKRLAQYGFDKLDKERHRELSSKGGKKGQQTKHQRKNMRDLVRIVAELEAQGNAKQVLENLGLEKNDQTNLAAVVVKTYQQALNGNIMATKLLADLLGEGAAKSMTDVLDNNDPNVIDMKYPVVALPDNGRDKRHDDMIMPQAGPQTMFLASSADIVIYGGAAGGGKTAALLLEGLRHRNVSNFGMVIFRHNFNQITAEGGLWDASQKFYYKIEGAEPKKTPSLHWKFSGGGRVSFGYLERDEDVYKWQGTEIAAIGFDELTHFSKKQFTYMLSRNRTTCGVRPYVRATCNPDADSWVASFISWWIDQDTGYPIKERSGQIRWMVMLNDQFEWGDSPEELAEKYGVNVEDCKSVTFIASRLEDNKILMESDPGYLANLKAMTEVDRERLLMGNWKIKAAAGKYFMRHQVEIIPVVPNDITMWCRAWDLAATDEDENGNADYTVGVLMGKRKNGIIVILDVVRARIKAGDVENLVLNTARIDKAKYGFQYMVRMAKDPGQAGKVQAQNYIKMLAGFNIKVESVTGSKELRATPFAAQWQNGNIQVLQAAWNDAYFTELESFPESIHDDQVDASSDAYTELVENDFDINNLL